MLKLLLLVPGILVAASYSVESSSTKAPTTSYPTGMPTGSYVSCITLTIAHTSLSFPPLADLQQIIIPALGNVIPGIAFTHARFRETTHNYYCNGAWPTGAFPRSDANTAILDLVINGKNVMDLMGLETLVIDALNKDIGSGDFGRALLNQATASSLATLKTPAAQYIYGYLQNNAVTVTSNTVTREPSLAPNTTAPFKIGEPDPKPSPVLGVLVLLFFPLCALPAWIMYRKHQQDLAMEKLPTTAH